MIFGTDRFSSIRNHHWTRRQVFTAAAGVAAIALLAGCGGGGDGGNNGGGNNGGGSRATLTGHIQDVNNTNAPVQGVTVNVNGASAVSDANGFFSISVSPFGSATSGTVTIPHSSTGRALYYNSGYYGGVLRNLTTEGFPVQAIGANESRDLGVIKLGSTDGPPFPPPI